MSSRSRVLAIEFLIAIIILNITSANRNLERSKRFYYGRPPEEEEQIKCQAEAKCEVYCFQQNKTSAESSVFNDVRCDSSGYHLHFVLTKEIILMPGWFVNNATIKKVTIHNAGDIAPGAFDDCTFRLVWSLELRGTSVSILRRGVLAGLNNLKNLAFYNNEMSEIEENALEGLFQLEVLIIEDQKQLTHLGNVTEKNEWKYLHTLMLGKNSFGSSIKKSTFKGCTQVQYLNLSNSEIESIGPQSFKSMEETLEVLDLSNNRIKTLPNGLIRNLIRPYVRLYLSNNWWDCGCASAELQHYTIDNSSLIIDLPLVCDKPASEKGKTMQNASITECYSTTTYAYDPSTTVEPPPVNLDHFNCFDQTDFHQAEISLETEYQFFNIIQESVGKVTIEINNPDVELALVLLNDYDFKAKCLFNLKRRMVFDSLYTKANYLFCLIKKSAHTTSPRNCLAFHFTEAQFFWGRDKIVITLICSFVLATILGVIIGWTLICRYRRASKSTDVLRYSRNKMIYNEYNSLSALQRGKLFMDSNNTGTNLRRSCSENSLASYKTYMTPSPIIEMLQRRNKHPLDNDYIINDYIDRLPYDLIPPPLPPYNGRRERIYETIIDPPFTSEVVPYVYVQHKY